MQSTRKRQDRFLHRVRLSWVYLDSVVKPNLKDCQTKIELQILPVNSPTQLYCYPRVFLKLLYRVPLSESGQPQDWKKESLVNRPEIRLSYTPYDSWARRDSKGEWKHRNLEKSCYVPLEDIAIKGVEMGYDYFIGGQIALHPFGVF